MSRLTRSGEAVPGICKVTRAAEWRRSTLSEEVATIMATGAFEKMARALPSLSARPLFASSSSMRFRKVVSVMAATRSTAATTTKMNCWDSITRKVPPSLLSGMMVTQASMREAAAAPAAPKARASSRLTAITTYCDEGVGELMDSTLAPALTEMAAAITAARTMRDLDAPRPRHARSQMTSPKGTPTMYPTASPNHQDRSSDMYATS